MKKERSDTKHKATHRGRRSTAALSKRRQRRDEPTSNTADRANNSPADFSPASGESCEADSAPLVFETTEFTLVHCNLNGCTAKHMAELHGHLQLLNFPAFVALNETKLTEETTDAELALTNYVLVSRRDRVDRGGGGVALFVHDSAASSVVLLEHSKEDERSWHLVHTTQGPLLLGSGGATWVLVLAQSRLAGTERRAGTN